MEGVNHLLRQKDRKVSPMKARSSGGGVSFARAGHFRYFFIFSTIKNDLFASFIKLIWLGMGFLNRTGAELNRLVTL